MKESLKEIGSDYASTIRDLVEALDSEQEEIREAAILEIKERPLEVCFRSGWEPANCWGNGKAIDPAEIYILLTTGGPAVRIRGEWNQHLETLDNPILEIQDWGTSWERYYEKDFDEILLSFVNCLL